MTYLSRQFKADFKILQKDISR
eukprot:UN16423